ncbi:MAG: hypothetical protein ACI8RN_001700, partial [Glaciecola sp.]
NGADLCGAGGLEDPQSYLYVVDGNDGLLVRRCDCCLARLRAAVLAAKHR